MNKKIAIITDVHGNLEALTSVLEDIKKNNFDEIICLGDSIDIGPNSKECIELLIENNVKSVLGNHEIYLFLLQLHKILRSQYECLSNHQYPHLYRIQNGLCDYFSFVNS